MSDLQISLQHETPADAAAIDDLHDRAFGPGRYARSAERIREGAPVDPRLCFVARVSTLLVGSVRLTPLKVGDTPGLLLGPLAVEPEFMNRGIGRALIERALQEAAALGFRLVLLVGDEPYYSRVGFRRVPPSQMTMPGPVDPARLLAWTNDAEWLKGVRGAIRPG
jgi:predicted N-acetyltransferase YhbS